MKLLFQLIALILISINAIAQSTFYYGFDQKIPIKPIEGKFVLRLSLESSLPKVLSMASLEASFNGGTYVIKVDKPENISAIRQTDGVVSLWPEFSLEDGFRLYPTEEVLLLLKKDVTDSDFQRLIKRLKLRVKPSENFYETVLLNRDQNPVEISNLLFETGLFEFAYPNFYAVAEKSAYIPNDPFFGMQFYLRNTGQTINDGHVCTAGIDINVTNAWDITKGNSNIIIAVVDEGVTSNHSDLPNSRQVRLSGSNFSGVGATNDPSPNANDNHGNACSGIIAATQDNNEGVSGIAPNCKIMPIKMSFGGGSSATDFANAITFADQNGANIISNSWGYSTPVTNVHPVIVTAITNAINNKKVVVFASGNTADQQASQTGFVNFPANCGVAGLMTVGATDRTGGQANYSPTSPLVDFVAPSHKAYSSQIAGETFEVWSIDIPGSSGYNPCNGVCASPSFVGETLPSAGTNFNSYTGRMGGTSSSCPEVAGIVALMLSVNECLSPNELKDILKLTAKKIGPFTYTNGKSQELGHGLVDATAAVENARTKFLQNTVETSTKTFLKPFVSAGFNVTSFVATGNYVVGSGADITTNATQEISLHDGFQAVNGSKFDAFIVTNPPCSQFTARLLNTSFNTASNDIPEESVRDNVEKALGEVRIYPNPNKGQFTIGLAGITEGEIEIYNVTGVLIEKIVLDKNNTKELNVNFEKYAKGLYFLNFQSEGKKVTKKIILE